jgi:hypothetical protein
MRKFLDESKCSLKRVLASAEILLVIFIFFNQILPHWSQNASTGDFLCLEVIAMLIYNIYDNLKNKIS